MPNATPSTGQPDDNQQLNQLLFSIYNLLFIFGVTFAAHVTCFEYSTGACECSFFPFLIFFILFYECECICCSFHLNYPVADLLVRKWLCTILKPLESTDEFQLNPNTNAQWVTFLNGQQYSDRVGFDGSWSVFGVASFMCFFNQDVCVQILLFILWLAGC